jgi:hypothetical protein
MQPCPGTFSKKKAHTPPFCFKGGHGRGGAPCPLCLRDRNGGIWTRVPDLGIRNEKNDGEDKQD